MADLSILDLATIVSGGSAGQALAETTEMAIAAERAGLTRLWVAEHHGMPGVASSAPAVLIAHLAARTDTIRLGSGGVMLPNHAPLVIAEQFGTLESLHPGRIDLGIGRAPGTDPRTARALGRANANHFPDQLLELISYFSGTAEQLAVPGRGTLPELWLLGSSTFSAQLAGMLGLPFSFAYHFSPQLLDQAVELYRSSFQPSSLLSEPRLMVAVTVLCAPSTEEAEQLAAPGRLAMLLLRQGRPSAMPTPEEADAYPYTDADRSEIRSASASHLVGDPSLVASGLLELEERTGAQELMLSTRAFGIAKRIRSVELAVEAYRAATTVPSQVPYR